MRALLLFCFLLLCGCGPGLVYHCPPQMTADEMLARADLILVGVVESQHYESWPFFRGFPIEQKPEIQKGWRILRRVVRVESVLRGTETAERLDVYEIFWAGGMSGGRNSTFDGERALFLVRKEGGKYHVVRDYFRSIFPVRMGERRGLPMDETHSFWERFALMNYWLPANEEAARLADFDFWFADPAGALSHWRKVKLVRGLLRHPNPDLRLAACGHLIAEGRGLDECWDQLSPGEWHELQKLSREPLTESQIATTRRRLDREDAATMWRGWRDDAERRLLTTINHPRLRREFCRLWQRDYPNDHDNGCPADAPPPATIVTEHGDVPLTGPWPH